MSDAHQFHPTVLREYDIRGVIGRTLSAADAAAVGRAFGTIIVRDGGTRVTLGQDGRLSSPEMAAALAEGLANTGLEVTRIGLGPTPMTYFSVKHLGADAGLMVTGSHNPPDYNGIKIARAGGPVYGSAIQEIGRIAAAGDFVRGAGRIQEADIRAAYTDRLVKDYTTERGLSIVWDAGNGATGEILQRLVERLPGRHMVLFGDIDGRFPNHHPDPTVPENLVDLIARVRETGADLGIGFDGDGDRIGAVDGTGRIVWGDQLLAIYSREVLAAHPGATIIADVKASQVLFDEVARLGGKPLMWRTGHSLLKAKMAEVGSPLAGEMSGHIFFADKYYGYDDALYCGVRLANLVASAGRSLADMVDELPQVLNTPETRFQVDESRKFQVPQEIKARLAGQPGLQVNDLDGVRVTTPDGWWLLRASNTQDVLVARAESGSAEGLARLTATIVDQLRASGVDAPSFGSTGGH